jgi:hypothetical protein
MSEATHGQQNRKEIQQRIELSLSKYCPTSIDRLADFLAYEYHLSPYTVRYTYLPMFLTVGILERCEDGDVRVTKKGIENIQRGELTDEQLGEELDEENEQRSKLGKPKVSLEEWKNLRSKRFKPIE